MKGFISYAHDDHTAYMRLRTHLKPVERSLGVDFWADKRLNPGDYWSDKIQQAIDDACIHILLMSPPFLASNYIFDYELPAINGKYIAGDLVIPVIAQRCCWQPFVSALQAAPSSLSGRLVPINEWRPTDSGFDAAREQVMDAIQAHFHIAPKPGLFGVRP